MDGRAQGRARCGRLARGVGRLRASVVLAIATLVALPTVAHAAFVTRHEAALEALFGNNGLVLDFRYRPTSVLDDASFLTLDDPAQLDALLALPLPPAPAINVFFVDELIWCGDADPSYVGCSQLDGNRGIVESVFAASFLGDELVAHELGHMFGLEHLLGVANLMSPTIRGGTRLSSAEIATILESPLVQNDGLLDFVEIHPIVVIPEPGTLLLLGVSLAGVAVLRRGQRPRPV